MDPVCRFDELEDLKAPTFASSSCKQIVTTMLLKFLFHKTKTLDFIRVLKKSLFLSRLEISSFGRCALFQRDYSDCPPACISSEHLLPSSFLWRSLFNVFPPSRFPFGHVALWEPAGSGPGHLQPRPQQELQAAGLNGPPQQWDQTHQQLHASGMMHGGRWRVSCWVKCLCVLDDMKALCLYFMRLLMRLLWLCLPSRLV